MHVHHPMQHSHERLARMCGVKPTSIQGPSKGGEGKKLYKYKDIFVPFQCETKIITMASSYICALNWLFKFSTSFLFDIIMDITPMLTPRQKTSIPSSDFEKANEKEKKRAILEQMKTDRK